jgi:gamma-glutamyltranspeptidase/glutathione hydrolase
MRLRSLVLACGFLAGMGAPSWSQRFEKEAVACNDRQGADAGAEILRRGGNAVDAAVATALALAVSHPAAGNLGGGGFLVSYDPEARKVQTFDFRERAPLSSTRTMYLGPDGEPKPGYRSGPRAAGVPGTPRGLELAWKRRGKLPWADLFGPAIALAKGGFPVSAPLADSLNAQLFVDYKARAEDENPGTREARLADFPASVRAFRKPDGSRWAAGDLLIQPELAATLERIAAKGADEFYGGETAGHILAYMKAGGGEITREDLESYRAIEREPIRFAYRDHELFGMAPPSSGGVTLSVMLRLLEGRGLREKGRDSAETLHLVTEAMRRGFFTRAMELGDPAFAEIDVAWLASKAYADRLGASIGEEATPSASLASIPIAGLGGESPQTTHLSVVDAAGGAVALTYTLEESYGSKAVVPGAGFLLNNEMGDFNLIPGRTDAKGRIGTDANLIAPGKRMLSSMSPTLVLKGGKVVLVTGSPGGRTIPNTVLWVLLDVLEFGMPVDRAVLAPRTHHAWFPDRVAAERGWPAGAIEGLRRKGHVVVEGGIQGDAHSIAVDPASGTILAAPDPRRGTSHAAGR